MPLAIASQLSSMAKAVALPATSVSESATTAFRYVLALHLASSARSSCLLAKKALGHACATSSSGGVPRWLRRLVWEPASSLAPSALALCCDAVW